MPAHPPASRAKGPITYTAIDRAILDFKRQNHAHIAQNPRRVREGLVRRIRSYFDVKRGPRPEPRIVKFYPSWKSGGRHRGILRQLYPGFEKLDWLGQRELGKVADGKFKRYEQRLHHASKKSKKPARKFRHVIGAANPLDN